MMTSRQVGATYDGLLAFLDHIEQKHLVKSATARSWKAACSHVFDTLDNAEKSDLSAIDLQTVFTRFKNKSGNTFTSASISTYESRVKKSLDEYRSYLDAPSAYKPSLAQRAPRSRPVDRGAGQKAPPDGTTHQPSEKDEGADVPGRVYNHEYPLRADIAVHISGIPHDLKIKEARRLGAFLETLCEDFVPRDS